MAKKFYSEGRGSGVAAAAPGCKSFQKSFIDSKLMETQTF
jgi:hypothetical protein